MAAACGHPPRRTLGASCRSHAGSSSRAISPNASAGPTLAELQTTKNAPSASDQIQALKGQIDAMASGSQTDMIRLQSLIAKRNDAIEMVSNLLQKFQTTQDQIIANMR